MTEPIVSLTARQLESYKVLNAGKQDDQRTNMLWVTLIVVLVIVVLTTFFIFYMIFERLEWQATTAITALDGVFGFCLRQIIASQWPTQKAEKT